ncbi:hypothetical protein ANN_27567 [Periplaneta americana]|uniref:Uncharacterized protein n=1 Tax=Periplaneta americana TaxID=6978 RepID=A0ABQ8RW84_PERAM|nr:hypothetical protein ANN_27567 [Periplaneta americana]
MHICEVAEESMKEEVDKVVKESVFVRRGGKDITRKTARPLALECRDSCAELYSLLPGDLYKECTQLNDLMAGIAHYMHCWAKNICKD